MIVIEIHVPVHIPGSVFCGIEVSREYEAYYSYLFFCTQGTGNGFLFSFNPISGEPVDTPPTGQVLNYRITQTSMLGELDDHFLRGILLMDPDNQVRPLPTHTFQSRSLTKYVQIKTILKFLKSKLNLIKKNDGYLIRFAMFQSLKWYCCNFVWRLKKF